MLTICSTCGGLLTSSSQHRSGKDCLGHKERKKNSGRKKNKKKKMNFNEAKEKEGWNSYCSWTDVHLKNLWNNKNTKEALNRRFFFYFNKCHLFSLRSSKK